MLSRLLNIFKVPGLRKRIGFTIMILLIFRLGAHIPIPGIDSNVLSEFFKNTGTGNLLSFFNTFSGGALTNLSIFALGVLPYISASIIIQLMTAVFPFLERLSKEGEQGRQKITHYTRLFAIGLSFFQSFFIVTQIQGTASPDGNLLVLPTLSPFMFTAIAVITLTTGTAFVMWMGEQVNERGIGNGISLIIFAGIVAGVPFGIFSTLQLLSTNELTILVLVIVAIIIVGVILAIIFLESSQRKIPISYPRRMIGRQMASGQSTFLPLKINSAGVIPPIFASSLLALPATFTAFSETTWVRDLLLPGGLYYNIVFVILIFFFCYFYTALQFNPVKISEELKKHGGVILSIRPGKKTAEYLNLILSRLTFIGSIYLCIVCILPSIMYSVFSVPFFFGGTALLIVIGVSLDTANQLETHLVQQNYDGFLKRKHKSKY